MKHIILLICSCNLISCSNSFIKHELQYEKQGACTEIVEPVKVIRNINGTRFEFSSCLDEGFNGKKISIVRQGDSLIVDFSASKTGTKANFKLILDIDAKPAYEHLVLDGRQLSIN